MIHQLFNMPNDQRFILACSGGADSMAIADFYRRGRKNFSLAYFHHGTPQADAMFDVVVEHANKYSIECLKGVIQSEREREESPEEFWRRERYAWLLSHNVPVVTAHHLDDAVETWIFSSLHGTPKLIAARNGQVMRPFLLNKKETLIAWCKQHSVEWFEDCSNLDTRFPRNLIRHEIVPKALKVNPGLHKVIAKKIRGEFNL